MSWSSDGRYLYYSRRREANRQFYGYELLEVKTIEQVADLNREYDKPVLGRILDGPHS